MGQSSGLLDPFPDLGPRGLRGFRLLIADNLIRRGDGRFRDREKYKALPDPLWDKAASPGERKFTPAEFRYDQDTHCCICPTGKRL